MGFISIAKPSWLKRKLSFAASRASRVHVNSATQSAR
jgi:hypothetical protein